MLLGKVRDALQLIIGDGVGGALSLYHFIPPDPNSPNSTPLTVLDVLRLKHSSPQQDLEETLVDHSSYALYVRPVIFERIDAKCIRSTALKTFGAGGPSRTDVYCWRRLCTSFGNSSELVRRYPSWQSVYALLMYILMGLDPYWHVA